jgi:hypothetical protein
MQGLKLDNINIITEDVSRSGITFSHLKDELIDHICCEVEKELEKGLTFDKAYEKVKNRIPLNKLEKIQEDTLKLIDKRYRIMKNIMKFIGLASLVFMAFGAMFKIQSWPAGGILLVTGFLILGLVFLPSALYVWKRESKLKGSMLIYIVSVIGGVIFLLGILFKVQHYPGAAILIVSGFSIIGLLLLPMILIAKLRAEKSRGMKLTYIIGAVSIMIYLFGDLMKIMHWPGALPLLVVGAVGLTTIFLPFYTAHLYKNAEKFKDSFVFICVGLLFFNLFILILSMKVSPNVMSYFEKTGNEIIKTTAIIDEDNNNLISSCINDSVNVNSETGSKLLMIKHNSDELVRYISSLKTELISLCDQVDSSEAIRKSENVNLIVRKDNYLLPSKYMIGVEKNGKAYELRFKLEDYKKKLMEIPWISVAIRENIDNSLITGNDFPEENGIACDWACHYFNNTVLITALHHLSTFQQRIRITEGEVIQQLFISNKMNPLQKQKIN